VSTTPQTFSSSPFSPPPAALIAGQVAYSIGLFNRQIPPTKAYVTSVAIASNVATFGLTVIEGNAPIVNQLISVQGTQTTTSGGAPNFNVVNGTITGVSGFTTSPNYNTGTVTVALTSTNISTTTDAGLAIMPVLATPLLLTGSTVTGIAFSMFSMSGLASNSRDVGWEIETPSAPSSFTAVLQAAMTNTDADYTTVDTTSATGQRTLIGVRACYLRIKFTAFSGGTNPSALGSILV